MKTKLRNIYIELWKVFKFFWKNLKNCSKITKKSLFFPLFGKKSFLNRTLGLRKSFLNQTTYVLKNRLHQQSFLNRDSFLNQAFLNRECTVFLSPDLDYMTHGTLQIDQLWYNTSILTFRNFIAKKPKMGWFFSEGFCLLYLAFWVHKRVRVFPEYGFWQKSPKFLKWPIFFLIYNIHLWNCCWSICKVPWVI